MDGEFAIQSDDAMHSNMLDRFTQQLMDALPEFAEKRASLFQQHIPATTIVWGKHFLPRHFAKKPSSMHEWLGSQLDAFRAERGSKVNVIGPRGSAKSTIATLCYVLRAAVEGWEPYIWIVSDTIPQTSLHLENVKSELLGNARLKNAYPHATGRGPTWRADLIELNNGVVIEALSTGQQVRGRRVKEHRPSLIIGDDLQNDSHISSARQRELSRQWFHGSLLPAGDARTNVVNLATALHREALAVQLLEAPGWTSRSFAAIQSWPTQMQLWNEWEAIYANPENPEAKQHARAFYEKHEQAMNEDVVVLWPEREDLYMLMQMRVESGRTAFEREKQGSPVDPASCEWPDEYFESHIWFDTWPTELTIRAIALDPSKGRDSARGDYSAFALVGIDPQGVVYVEADMARRPTPQIVTDGVTLCQRFCPDVFGVEANQFQELLCGEFKAEFCRRGLAGIVPAAIHNHVSKLVRIRRLGPLLSQKRIRFLSGNVATRLLVDQLRDFPAGAHDDGPDALEMALRLAEEIRQGRNTDDGLGDRLPLG